MNAIQTLHRSPRRAVRRPAAAILAAAAALLISSWSCKSPTSPDAGEADIIILSHWSDPVDVFMDGTFKFSLTYKDSAEIDNVSRASHLMEAKSRVTGELIAQKTLEITTNSDYTWTIERRPRINCLNSFGEALKIFMDGTYQFDLVHGENRWLLDVSLGDHLLAAFKRSDGKEVSSITLKVTENKSYVWTIEAIQGSSLVPMIGD